MRSCLCLLSTPKNAAAITDKAAPLKAEEERLQYAIKQLSRSNEEVQADIAAVDEAIEYLQEQRELWPTASWARRRTSGWNALDKIDYEKVNDFKINYLRQIFNQIGRASCRERV